MNFRAIHLGGSSTRESILLMIEHFFRVVCLMCLVGLIGCGSGRVPVQGVATYKGKPIKGAQIVFFPEKGDASASPSSAVVDADGNFQLETAPGQPGVALGDYRVTVMWYQQETTVRGETITVGKELLGDRFSKRDTTPLRVSVTGSSEPIVLQLD
ncbi:MAG: carboxypeptidase-like regulatory domain-containing protein [Gemmataceae bacterium]